MVHGRSFLCKMKLKIEREEGKELIHGGFFGDIFSDGFFYEEDGSDQ